MARRDRASPREPRALAAGRALGWRELATAAILAVLAGAGAWLLWRGRALPMGAPAPGLEGHGPDPHAWPRLLVLWLPGAHLAFAGLYLWMARVDPGGRTRAWFRADQAVTGAGVAAIMAAIVASGPDGPARTALGAGYAGLLAAKTALLLRALWLWLEGPVSARQRVVAAFLAALVPGVMLDAHVVTAISATGDEPYYLLVAHSLLHEGDLDLADEFVRRDYEPFYWGRLAEAARGLQVTADGRIYATAFQGAQPLVLLPGYWVAGRLGAIAVMTGAAALAMAVAFHLACASGAGLRAAFLAWLGVTFSVPLLSFEATAWPEMTGAALVTGAAALLSRRERLRGTLALAAACLAAAVAVKTRLVIAAAPVALGFARRLGWRVIGLAAALGVAALTATALYDVAAQHAIIARRFAAGGLPGIAGWLARWTVQWPGDYRGHLGLLLDQEFGIVASAPVLALAAAGVAVAWRRKERRLLLLTVGPFALAWHYLGGVDAVRATADGSWAGGFAPAGRFVAAALPPLAVCAARALDGVRGRAGWTLVAALYVLTLGHSLVLAVRPAWRFQDGAGRATALAALFRRTGLDAGRWLPSYVTPGPEWLAPGVALLALMLLAGWRLAGRPGAAPPRGTAALGTLVAALVAAALPVAAWLHPAGRFPATLGAGRAGTLFHGVIVLETPEGAVARDRLVWAAQRAGALELSPRLPAGRYRVTVRAGAQADGPGPVLGIRLGPLAAPGVPMDAASPPRWREQPYAADLRWPGGRLPIRIELGGVGSAPVRLAYVDAVEIQALPDRDGPDRSPPPGRATAPPARPLWPGTPASGPVRAPQTTADAPRAPRG